MVDIENVNVRIKLTQQVLRWTQTDFCIRIDFLLSLSSCTKIFILI